MSPDSPEAGASAPDLHSPELYLNRELSQLEFNFRVLAQAKDPRVPLLERLRYLCISCTNLDEFFEIRAATVRTAQQFGGPLPPDGIPPTQALELIHDKAASLVEEQYRYWNETLRPELNAAGIRILAHSSWNARQKKWLHKYFQDELLPVLSPLGLDPVHPFPRILNKSLNVVVVLEGKDAFGRNGGMAIVRAPRSLPRIIQLPPEVSGGQHDFVLLSAVLTAFVDDLFTGMKVKGAYQFRVTRNSELFVDEEEVENLASALKDELASRGFRPAVRLEIAEHCPKPIVRTLLHNFGLTENAVYRINGPVNLNRVTQVYDLVDRPDLKFPAFKPGVVALDADAPFETLRQRDVLLHHPYQSFQSVLDLLQHAANPVNWLPWGEAAFARAGLRVSRNAPFAGAYIAQAYGRPSRGFHVVQVEIDRALYMDEARVEKRSDFNAFRALMAGVIEEVTAGFAGGAALAAE